MGDITGSVTEDTRRKLKDYFTRVLARHDMERPGSVDKGALERDLNEGLSTVIRLAAPLSSFNVSCRKRDGDDWTLDVTVSTDDMELAERLRAAGMKPTEEAR